MLDCWVSFDMFKCMILRCFSEKKNCMYEAWSKILIASTDPLEVSVLNKYR